MKQIFTYEEVCALIASCNTIIKMDNDSQSNGNESIGEGVERLKTALKKLREMKENCV